MQVFFVYEFGRSKMVIYHFIRFQGAALLICYEAHDTFQVWIVYDQEPSIVWTQPSFPICWIRLIPNPDGDIIIAVREESLSATLSPIVFMNDWYEISSIMLFDMLDNNVIVDIHKTEIYHIKHNKTATNIGAKRLQRKKPPIALFTFQRSRSSVYRRYHSHQGDSTKCIHAFSFSHQQNENILPGKHRIWLKPARNISVNESEQ